MLIVLFCLSSSCVLCAQCCQCLWIEMVHDRCSTLLTEFGTALTTILPILFQYCYKYCNSDSQNLWVVMKARGETISLEMISLEMPIPSQGHYDFHSFPVVDWFCLYINLWVLTFSLEDCSEFGNFVITLIVHS